MTGVDGLEKRTAAFHEDTVLPEAELYEMDILRPAGRSSGDTLIDKDISLRQCFLLAWSSLEIHSHVDTRGTFLCMRLTL